MKEETLPQPPPIDSNTKPIKLSLVPQSHSENNTPEIHYNEYANLLECEIIIEILLGFTCPSWRTQALFQALLPAFIGSQLPNIPIKQLTCHEYSLDIARSIQQINQFNTAHKKQQLNVLSIIHHMSQEQQDDAVAIIEKHKADIARVISQRIALEKWCRENTFKIQFQNSIDSAVASLNRFSMSQVFLDTVQNQKPCIHMDTMQNLNVDHFGLYGPVEFAYLFERHDASGIYQSTSYNQKIACKITNITSEFDLYVCLVHEGVHKLSLETLYRLGFYERYREETRPFNEAWTDIVTGLIVRKNFHYTKQYLKGHPICPSHISYGYEPEMAIAKKQANSLKTLNFRQFINALFSEASFSSLKEAIAEEYGSYEKFSAIVYKALYK